MLKSRILRNFLILSILIGGLAFHNASAGSPYSAYNVEFIADGFPAAINEPGQVAGYEQTSSAHSPWVYTPGNGVQSLPLPDGFTSGRPHDINDAGTIVGEASPSIYTTAVAVRWDPVGSTYQVSILNGLPGSTHSMATAVNNLGDIVGFSVTLGSKAVLFTAPGGAQDLQALGLFGTPADINDQRQVVAGQLRLDLDTNALEDIGVPTGGTTTKWTTAAGMNNHGQVASTGFLATSTDNNRTVARYSDGSGWLVVSGAGKYNSAIAINDNGDVLGNILLYCLGSGGSSFNAAVYLNNQGTLCMRDLLHEDQRGWSLGSSGPMDINSARQIVTTGGNQGTNQFGVVLLTPAGTLPPPSAPANLTAVPHEATWQQPWNAISLSWQDTSLLDFEFRVERKGPGDPDFVEIAQTRVTSLWDMDVGLDTTYEYRVRAVGLGGFSGFSNIASATSPATPVDRTPPVVNIVQPQDGSQVSGNVQIMVDASDNAGLNFMDVDFSPFMGDATICTGYPGGAQTFTLTCNWNTRNLAPGLYNLHAYAADELGNYATQTISVQVGSTANPTLRSSAIDLSAKVRRGTPTVTGKVTVVDQDGKAVRSAIVSAVWTLPDGSTVSRSAYTNRKSIASFSASSGPGTYTLTVQNIIKTGYTFDSAGSILNASVTP